jgi:hypothetical protein
MFAEHYLRPRLLLRFAGTTIGSAPPNNVAIGFDPLANAAGARARAISMAASGDWAVRGLGSGGGLAFFAISFLHSSEAAVRFPLNFLRWVI